MIRVQNIYYMLSYAFSALQATGYRSVATEEFENVSDLCAAILIQGMNSQLKRGLARGYVEKTDTLSSPRGKIEVSASLRSQAYLRKELVCTYDEFSEDIYLNRVVKSTLLLLLREGNVSVARCREIRRLLRFLTQVSPIDIAHINWRFQYNRNNQTYRMLIGVCELVVKGLLQTEADGTSRLMSFMDEQYMHRLYEKFLLEYYTRHHPELSPRAAQIPWALDDNVSALLPIMQTDITLQKGNHVLIIDAKYYSHATQQQFDKRSVHSGNLYQIFTYVKNAALSAASHEVSGMLLYAKTDEEEISPHEYSMSGNRISVRTLDLSGDFEVIRGQLNDIAEKLLC